MAAGHLRSKLMAVLSAAAILVTPPSLLRAIEDAAPTLPVDVGARVVAHASSLASRGPRPAGSQGERAAAAYVEHELRSAGLSPARESFRYDVVEIAQSRILLAGREAEALLVAFDPARSPLTAEAEAIPAQASADPPQGVAGRLVVADHPLMQLMLLDQGPSAVVTVSEENLERFIAQPSRAVSVHVDHRTRSVAGVNVIASLGPDSSPFRILVTAHLDAYQSSPGANDNGTGLGALVELARAMRPFADQLEVPITFVAFGAEELGAVGSRAYLDRHAADLKRIAAVVNLDTLGGADGPQIGAVSGVRNVPEDRRRSQVPGDLADRAWEDTSGRWRMNHTGMLPYVASACYPAWLQAVVADAAAELQLEPRERGLMSDHCTFAQAGVPAISIQSGTHRIHSEADTVDALVPATVEAGTRLAAAIVWQIERRLAEGAAGPLRGQPRTWTAEAR